METFIEIITIGGSLLSGIVILYAGFLFFVIKNSETNEGFFINVPQEQVVTLEQGGAHDRFLHRGKSELWPTKDSLLVRYANGTQQVTLYPKFMGKVTDVHFYSNHFELKLPDASPHESDEVTFKLAVN